MEEYGWQLQIDEFSADSKMAVMGEVLCCGDKCNLHKNSNGGIVLFLENANFSLTKCFTSSSV
jgi:hypothetical protein